MLYIHKRNIFLSNYDCHFPWAMGINCHKPSFYNILELFVLITKEMNIFLIFLLNLILG